MAIHLQKLSINGNPNIGLYAFATDKYCLIGHEVPDHQAEQIYKILKVPVYKISMAGTSMIGAFCAGNSNMLLVPQIAFDHELSQLKQLKIPFTIINSKLTALGNNISANDHGAIVSPGYQKDAMKKIETALATKVVQMKIAGFENVGSLIAVTNKGAYLHSEVSDEDIELLNKTLDVESEAGTINMGNPYINSGIIANSKGLLIGESSSGIEIAQADRALGFLKR